MVCLCQPPHSRLLPVFHICSTGLSKKSVVGGGADPDPDQPQGACRRYLIEGWWHTDIAEGEFDAVKQWWQKYPLWWVRHTAHQTVVRNEKHFDQIQNKSFSLAMSFIAMLFIFYGLNDIPAFNFLPLHNVNLYKQIYLVYFHLTPSNFTRLLVHHKRFVRFRSSLITPNASQFNPFLPFSPFAAGSAPVERRSADSSISSPVTSWSGALSMLLSQSSQIAIRRY